MKKRMDEPPPAEEDEVMLLDRPPRELDGPPAAGKPLCSEAVAILESLPKSQFVFHSSFRGFTHPGGLDLFSGRYGVAKQQFLRAARGCLRMSGTIQLLKTC